MARTRTPGIRVDRNGWLIIDKEHQGIPIYARLGFASQECGTSRMRITRKSSEVGLLDAGILDRDLAEHDAALHLRELSQVQPSRRKAQPLRQAAGQP